MARFMHSIIAAHTARSSFPWEKYRAVNSCAHTMAGNMTRKGVACRYSRMDRNGGKLPKPSIRSYPVKVRYGLVWLFPGNPERAQHRKIPEIPELEGAASGGPAYHSVSRGLPTTR